MEWCGFGWNVTQVDRLGWIVFRAMGVGVADLCVVLASSFEGWINMSRRRIGWNPPMRRGRLIGPGSERFEPRIG